MSKKIDYFEQWEETKGKENTDNKLKFNLELVNDDSLLRKKKKKEKEIKRTESDILRRSEINAVKDELFLLRTGEKIFQENNISSMDTKYRRAQLIYVRDALSAL